MFGNKFNLGSIMKNAKQMQEMMEKAQEELAKIEVSGESGAGAVKITMNARHYVKSVTVEDDILKESKEVLEDLIAAAINDATQKVETVAKSKMMDSSKLFDMDDDQGKE